MPMYTPGPWKACGHKTPKGPCKCGIVHGPDHPIAKVEIGKWGDEYPAVRLVEYQGGPGVRPGTIGAVAEAVIEMVEYGEIAVETALANAALISAAPDLLEATKHLLWCPKTDDGCKGCELAGEAVRKAESVP